MPLIAIASVKGSPGVTATALALAGAWPAPRRLLIEADPSGGDLAPWLGLPPGHGLARLAAAGSWAGPAAWEHAAEAAGGLHVLAAPAGAEHTAACLATLEPTTILDQLAAGPAAVIADCGRLDPASPARWVAARASVLLILTRPYAADLAHLADRVSGLADTCGQVALLLAPRAARAPSWPAYPAREISAELRLPVLAGIPSDPHAVTRLIRDRGDAGRTRRAPLLRTAAGLTSTLIGILPGSAPPAPARQSPARSVTQPGGGDRT
jgi:Mrp family chromosome partitioning ATPase